MKKRDVLRQLYSSVAPHRGRFAVVVFATLLSTGAGLVEPLIYREVINDIAGLFVKRANDTAKSDAGEELETSDNPFEEFLHRQICPNQPVPANKT